MKDSFSGKNIPPGTGLIYVKKDGTIHYFAGTKTKRNFLKLKRNPNETRWTEGYRKIKATRMQSKSTKAEKAPVEPVAPLKAAKAKKGKSR